MSNDIFMKIPKDIIYETDDLSSFRILLLSYLYFKRDFNNQITTSIALICQELNLTFGRSTSSGSQIFTLIKSLIADSTLILEPRLTTLTPDQITRSSLFTVTYNPPYQNITANYTILNLSEMNQLQNYLMSNSISIRTDKLLRLFLLIKSNINTKKSGTTFFISNTSMRSLLRLGHANVQEALDILEDAELITSPEPQHYTLVKFTKNS